MKPHEPPPEAPGTAASLSLPWSGWQELSRSERHRIAGYASFLVLATLAFGQSLLSLIGYARQSELNSHIPLVPVISLYLLYSGRHRLPTAYDTSVTGGVLFIGLSLAAMAGRALWPGLSVNDTLAVDTVAFVSLVAAGGFLFLGSRWMSRAAFPALFLVLMVPMPDAMVNAFETASMLASADVAALLLRATGTPLLRDAQVFSLPGITLEVAEACSGIRSSWVLMITSLLGAHMFLKSPWQRLVLVLFVIPLGIIRNGFRILVIGLLCVYVGPHMIDSVIHRRGGPLFFVLSLGPLLLLLWWLRRRDAK